MTRDEAVALVHQTLGFRTDQATNIVTNMKLAQQTLEKGPIMPWFLLSEGSTRRTELNERRVRIPTDFLREYEEGTLTYVPDDATLEEVDLIKDSREILQEEYGSLAAGPPEKYSLDGYYFNIFPLPDDDYLLKMRYYKQAALLTTNIENEWLLEIPLLIIGAAGLLLAPGLRDKEATKTFADWSNQGQLILNGYEETRVHTNRPYQIGGEH